MKGMDIEQYLLDLDAVSAEIYGLLKEKVAAVMKQHGEDPGSERLLALRVVQAAYGADSLARKAAARYDRT